MRSGNPAVLKAEKPLEEGTFFYESNILNYKCITMITGLLIPSLPRKLITCVLLLYQRKQRLTQNTVCVFWMHGGKRELIRDGGEADLEADIPLIQMDKKVMKHWLTLLVLEVSKQNGTEYPPNTLHHIVCGIMRYLKQNGINIDFYQDPEFAGFRQSLNAEDQA